MNNTENSLSKERKRVVWLDILKLIAIFMVVAGHSADFVSPEERFEPWYNVWGTFWGSFMRPAVPLFVMITGALLLPVKTTTADFYKKRIPRILVPFLVWSILYDLFPWFTGLAGCEPEVIRSFFPWGETSQALSDALFNIAMIPLRFSSSFGVQMWYVYLLIGLYLYLPVFSAWVSQAGKRDQQIFLGFWFITLFMPYIREYITPDLWGTCSWNEFGMFYYFAGFNGYLLLGYYLTHHPIKWSNRVLTIVSVLLFTIGYATTYIGFRAITSIPGQPDSLVELFLTYCSPNVMLMTLAIFIAAQRIKVERISTKKALKSIAECTLGIWMIHYFLLGPCNSLISMLGCHSMIQMLLCSILLFFVSWLVVFAIRRCGNIGKWLVG